MARPQMGPEGSAVPRSPRRLLLAAAAAVAAAGVATACSSSPATPSAHSSGGLTPATLKLAALASAQPGMDKVIADWQAAHPDVKVQATYLPAGDPYTTTVSTQFSGGNGPDLVWLTAGHASPTSAQVFAQKGYLADLSKQPWTGTMYPVTKPLFSNNGQVVVRDFGLQPLSLLNYSVSYFSQRGLQPPTTFSGLLALCRTIAGQGKTPIAWGGASEPVNANNVAVLAGNTVMSSDPGWLAQAIAGKATFAGTPGWSAALQEVLQMKSANCFSPGAGGESLNQMISDFAGGSAPMMFTTTGLIGNVLKLDPSLKVGIFAAPGPTAASTRITTQAAGGLGINAKSANLTDAEAFLTFASQPAELAKETAANSVISPLDAADGNLTGLYAGIKSYFTSNKVLADPTAQWPNTAFNTNAGSTIQGLFTGQDSVTQVLASLDKFFTTS
jgi:raffinose/stachyose/melibiose transport system substrate-binding protein